MCFKVCRGLLWGVSAVLGCLLPLFPAVAADPDRSALVVLPQAELRVAAGSVSTAALSADGRRLYLGLRYSYRVDRHNLVVLTLDAAGKPVGRPRRYADSAVDLPEKTHATITGLLVDSARRKLYLTRVLQSARPADVSKLLTVWDLDEQGEPAGNPRSYECGNPNKALHALARHPRHPLLYLVGWGGAAVYVYRLDEQGWPTGAPQSFPVGGQGKYEVAAGADGKRLYLGTYPDLLEVVDLDDQGLPAGKPHVFTAGKATEYLRFRYSPKALYLRRATADGPRLAVWPLDGGDPVGEPKVRESVPVNTMTLDPAGRRLWLAQDATFRDVFSDKPVVSGVDAVELPLGPDGMPAAPARRDRTLDGQAAVVLAAGPDNTVLLTEPAPARPGNHVRGERLRVTLLDLRLANGKSPETATASLTGVGKPVRLGTLRSGTPSDWLDLDPYLKDVRKTLPAGVTVGPPYTPAGVAAEPGWPAHLRLRVEIAAGDPDRGGRVLKSWTDTVEGETLLFLLPGYASEPAAGRADALELMSEHARRYLDAARAAAVKPEDRPKQFPVSCYQLMGGQGHREQLGMAAETAGLLGFNTVNAYSWGRIPPRDVNAVLDAHGLKWRSVAVYNPPSYFDFDRDLMNPKALDRWAAARAAAAGAQNGGTAAGVVLHYLADEPGWYYPTMLLEVRKKPERLEAFRAYLREQKLQPADLGRQSWEEVFPLGAGAARDLPARKLFYWTMRFFPESASRGHRLATEALERAFGHRLLTPVNWNNWTDRWYVASPYTKVANNNVIGPDSAMGGLDWLDAGRRQALTPWTEDWFPDQNAQTWSYYGDLLRSAAELGGRDFGGYVIGGMTGEQPAGARLKTLALAGHGAKAVDFYTWGPELLFPGNCWSESWRSYRPIADAVRALGRSERLLYPGRPERGKVAVFLPAASGLWDEQQRAPFYQQEIGWLHAALVHAGYTVDFVDDADVAGGALATRGYGVLYLTAPNMAAAAVEKIGAWVHDGGTLAVTPGAGVADEYNTPVAALSGILGLKPRQACRTPVPPGLDPLAEHPAGRLTFLDDGFGNGELALYGPRERLELDGAGVAARWQDSEPALTLHKHGKGRSVAYGFFPGWQYWRTPDRGDRSHLPRSWDGRTRQLAVAPAALAKVPRPVVLDRPVVEACRLQSDRGIAVVLLNWTDDPIERLTVAIPAPGPFRKVTSIQQGELPGTVEGGALRMRLPLRDADVLLIE
jgi:hypothetical protein